MSNQYSCGCSYNYRHSMQNDTMQPSRVSAAIQKGCNADCEMKGCTLAMAYVPMQEWSRPLPPCKGLSIGTIFADLNKPFCGRGGARR